MTTLYKKVGRRYRPVAEHEEWDSYPAGRCRAATQPDQGACGRAAQDAPDAPASDANAGGRMARIRARNGP